MKTQSVRVLHVEDSSTMRDLIRNLVQDLGLQPPVTCDTATAAVRLLEDSRFDVILSDYDLGEGPDGQSFLEKVRKDRLVPRETVFIMLTAERSYARVAQVVELAPDDYLVKPFAARVLELRLFAQLARVSALRPVLAALDANDPESALALARAIAKAEGPHQREALRLTVEAMVALERFDEALPIVERLIAMPAGPRPPRWAMLERARILRRRGEMDAARAAFEAVLEPYPHYVVPRDALYEMALEEDNLAAAHVWIDRALQVSRTPARARRLGELELLLDRPAPAERAFIEAMERGRYSFFQDTLDHALAAHAAFAQGARSRAYRIATEGIRQVNQSDESRVLLPLQCAAIGELPERVQDEIRQGMRALDKLPRDRAFAPMIELVLGDYLLRFDAFREAMARLERVRSKLRPSSTLFKRIDALHERAKKEAHHYEVWGMTSGEAERRRQAQEDAAIEKNNQAVTLLKAGRIGDAIVLVEEALVDSPEHETLLANAASMRLTRFMTGQSPEDLAAAEAHLAHATTAGLNGEDFDTLKRRIQAIRSGG